jgi:hypothetical protein
MKPSTTYSALRMLLFTVTTLHAAVSSAQNTFDSPPMPPREQAPASVAPLVQKPAVDLATPRPPPATCRARGSMRLRTSESRQQKSSSPVISCTVRRPGKSPAGRSLPRRRCGNCCKTNSPVYCYSMSMVLSPRCRMRFPWCPQHKAARSMTIRSASLVSICRRLPMATSRVHWCSTAKA